MLRLLAEQTLNWKVRTGGERKDTWLMWKDITGGKFKLQIDDSHEKKWLCFNTLLMDGVKYLHFTSQGHFQFNFTTLLLMARRPVSFPGNTSWYCDRKYVTDRRNTCVIWFLGLNACIQFSSLASLCRLIVHWSVGNALGLQWRHYASSFNPE